ncbi:MAG: ABC transporter permease subunit [Planctomycetota bacterium]
MDDRTALNYSTRFLQPAITNRPLRKTHRAVDPTTLLPARWTLWLAISRMGVRLAFRSRLLRRFVFVAWAPMLYFLFAFFTIGWITDHNNAPHVERAMEAYGEADFFAQTMLELGFTTLGVDESKSRRQEWSYAMQSLRDQGYRLDPALFNVDKARAEGIDVAALWADARERIVEKSVAMMTEEGWDPAEALEYVRENWADSEPPEPNPLLERLRTDPESLRNLGWSLGFSFFFMFTQTAMLLFVVSIVGPPLIARDSERTWQLYLSRPITALDYVAGKAGVICFTIALTTLVPALVLYAATILFSPSAHAMIDTLAVVPRLVLASAVIALPVSALILCISSRAGDERYAMFTWIGLVLVGEAAYHLLSFVPAFAGKTWIHLLSLRQCLVRSAVYALGTDQQFAALGSSKEIDGYRQWLTGGLDPTPFVVMLAIITVLCFLDTVRNVRRLAAR